MRILGLDLSITSPGFCIMTVGDDYSLQTIELHGFTDTNKWMYIGENLTIYKKPDDYNDNPAHHRSQMIYNIVEPHIQSIDYVAVEDYAFCGTGKVFDLAEFGGGFKNIIYLKNIPMKKYPPSTVKQCATGNGGADKILMLMAFKQSTISKKVNPHIFSLPEGKSPQEDLVDSIFLSNVLRCELSYRETGKFPLDAGMPLSNCMTAIVTGKKGASTRPAIEHPIITLGNYSRVAPVKKKPKKAKNIEDAPVLKIGKSDKKVLQVPSNK